MVPTYMAPPSNGGQEAESSYMAHPQFPHPTMYFSPYAQYPPPYMMRPEGQMPMSTPQYFAPVYARPPSAPGVTEAEVAPSQHVSGERAGESGNGK